MAYLRCAFPEGKPKALTMSYDDGTTQDRRLVEIFNRHGIRATFHLNSGLLDKDKKISKSEIPGLFAGHEIAVHSVTHPFLERLPIEDACAEISRDRHELERLCGTMVRGMSYPFGTWNDAIVRLLPAIGIDYSRTTLATSRFDLPRNLLLWDPTCHHNDDLLGKAREFLSLKEPMPALFYVWGHSYELDRDESWGMIESFCEMVSGREDVWYATNIDIADYITALRSLCFTADRSRVLNRSSCPVWMMVDDRIVEVRSGDAVSLE